MSIELCVALVAIVFTFYQAWLARHHNRLSVKPHLQTNHLRNWNNDGLEYRVIIENYGLGPARIDSINLFYDGSNFVTKEDDPVREIISKAYSGVLTFQIKSSSFPSPNYVIKSQSSYLLAHVTFPGLKKKDVSTLDGIMNTSLDLKIEYSSFYGESDKLDTRG